MDNVIKLIRNNNQCTQTQISIASIDASLANNDFDIVNFCQEKGIDNSNLITTARLLQVADYLNDFWEDNKENADELRNPDTLYKRVVRYIKNVRRN